MICKECKKNVKESNLPEMSSFICLACAKSLTKNSDEFELKVITNRNSKAWTVLKVLFI